MAHRWCFFLLVFLCSCEGPDDCGRDFPSYPPPDNSYSWYKQDKKPKFQCGDIVKLNGGRIGKVVDIEWRTKKFNQYMECSFGYTAKTCIYTLRFSDNNVESRWCREFELESLAEK